jgi:hypothetical protein
VNQNDAFRRRLSATPFGDAFGMPSRGISSLRIRDTVPASSASKIVGNFEWAGGYTWRYGFAYVGFQREKSGIDCCQESCNAASNSN